MIKFKLVTLFNDTTPDETVYFKFDGAYYLRCTEADYREVQKPGVLIEYTVKDFPGRCEQYETYSL